MFKLNDFLIDEFVYKGQTIKLDLSFDNVLDVLEIFETETDNALQIMSAIELLITEPRNVLEIYESDEILEILSTAFDKFINVDNTREIVKLDLTGQPIKKRKNEQATEKKAVLSFIWDAEFIWSSFMYAYNMDLHNYFGRLHWRKFQALLRDLPDDSKIKKIIEIRTWKANKHTSTEERKQMQELQKAYELPE